MAIKKKKARTRYTAQPARETQSRGQTIVRAIVSILIVIVVAVTVVSLILRDQSQITITENAVGSLISPVQSALNTASVKVKDFFTNWRDYDKLQDEYAALERENQQLSLELSNADEALMENERLKNLLDARSSYEALDPIYARVIARDAGQWFSTFSINRGDMHGVSAGMAVVNGDGLVGRVYEVGMNYANVITIIDPRSSLACLVQRTRDNGIMEGGVADNADTAECYIYYLPNVNNIVPGDEIVTSGTDGFYPKGLNVGTVTQVSLDAGSEGNFAVVEPHVDFLHIEEVIVLRDVVEKADQLSALPTATPSPTATPAPTSGVSAVQPVAPETTEEIFTFPQAGDADSKNNSANTSTAIEPLPEDAWVEH